MHDTLVYMTILTRKLGKFLIKFVKKIFVKFDAFCIFPLKGGAKSEIANIAFFGVLLLPMANITYFCYLKQL